MLCMTGEFSSQSDVRLHTNGNAERATSAPLTLESHGALQCSTWRCGTDGTLRKRDIVCCAFRQRGAECYILLRSHGAAESTVAYLRFMRYACSSCAFLSIQCCLSHGLMLSRMHVRRLMWRDWRITWVSSWLMESTWCVLQATRRCHLESSIICQLHDCACGPQTSSRGLTAGLFWMLTARCRTIPLHRTA